MTKHVKYLTRKKILIKKQGTKCCYCGVRMTANNKFSPRSITLEHLHRKVDGGSSAIDNKALACADCNSGRGSKDWLTYKSIKMGEVAP